MDPQQQHPDGELLRSIGQVLERHQAQDLHLTTQAQPVSLTWHEGWGGSQMAQGRLLRALGPLLAHEEIQPVAIHPEGDGFQVAGVRRGRYLHRHYARARLEQHERSQQAQRTTAAAEATPPALGPCVRRWRRVVGARAARPPL